MPIHGTKLMQHTLFITSRYSIALEKSITYQDQRAAAQSREGTDMKDMG